jgi:hypothetical protein
MIYLSIQQALPERYYYYANWSYQGPYHQILSRADLGYAILRLIYVILAKRMTSYLRLKYIKY